MTDEAKAGEGGDPAAHGERYPDIHALYRRWYDIVGEARDGSNEASSAELGEFWRRWFEAMAGFQKGALEAEGGLFESMSPLWRGMVEDITAKALSGEAAPEDPIKFFLEWYNETNERWSETADELLREHEVLEAASGSLEAYTRFQGELRRVAEEGLERLRLPANADISRVAKLVLVVENKVDRIEEAFEEFVYGDSEPATAGAVGGLEERMDRLEGKMDRILAALEKLGDGRELPGSARGPDKPEDAETEITPLEGLSLGLIEASYAGAWGRDTGEANTREED